MVPGEPRPRDATPERLGRYRLVRPISTGGMARVYEGRRESLAGVSPRVAIKVILPDFAADEGFQRLFVNEARVGSQLQHQNLVQIQDFDRQGEHFYLVMEFVDGVTLRRAIGLCRKHGLLIPVPVVAEIGRQVCDGLHYAHTACGEDGAPLHLIHRDVKPSNLMLNGQGLVKVLDFGISRALFSREREGTVKGTWGYMAPEQAAGREVGPPADVFGLAAVLYELATLNVLFPESEPAALRELLANDEAARRSAALGGPAGALTPLLVRALQRDPLARFPSALAFQRALAGLQQNPVTAREQLVHFWSTLMELQGENPSGGAFRSQASTLDPASRGSGHVSSASAASAASAGVSSHGSLGSGPVAPGAGLPVAVGHAPADLDLGEPLELEETPARRSSPLLWVLGLIAALAILAFAAARVLWPGVADPPGPGRDMPQVSLGAVVGAAGEGALVTQPPADPARSPGPIASPVAARAAAPAAVRAAPPAASAPRDPDASAPIATPASPAPTPAEDPGVTDGMLTLGSRPRAQVAVDGQHVGWTPLLQHPLSPGPHTVGLTSEDGRHASFRVTMVAGEELRKSWIFDEEKQGP